MLPYPMGIYHTIDTGSHIRFSSAFCLTTHKQWLYFCKKNTMKAIITLLLSILLLTGYTQIIPKENIKPLIIKSSLMFVSGFCDGTSEVLKIKYESFDKVINGNDQFWDYNISWINKYKDGKPPDERFFGSKTFLVWTTDGYHMMRMARNCTMITAIVIPIGKRKNWKSYVVEGVCYYISYTAGFNLSYDVVFK